MKKFDLKNIDFSKMAMTVIGVIILILIVIFGINVYQSYQPEKFDSSKVNVLVQKKEGKDNEMIVTVNPNQNGIYISEYSFDGGKTWQDSNEYLITENKILNIKFKDVNGREIGSLEYAIEDIDREGPKLVVNLPSEVELNETIDLLSYASATDKSGIKGNIIVEPSSLDTSSSGTKRITYKAIDNLNNETVVTVEVTVIQKNSNDNSNESPGNSTGGESKPSEPIKKTYYRYRTRTVQVYDCEYYACDYLDYNDKQSLTAHFDENSYCCNSGNCKKTNPEINNPCLPGMYCAAVMVKQYQVQDNVCYNASYIHIENNSCPEGRIYIDGACYKIESVGTVLNGCTKGSCVQFASTSPCSKKLTNLSRYQIKDNVCYDTTDVYVKSIILAPPVKTNCDSDEINISGYCHKIDSKATYSCPSGYVLSGNECVKVVNKTCSKTCSSEIWSEWSNWSTTKVIENINVQVQTKVQ